ncbi:GNAT family N-acetyltransferase [Gluconacetobacter tumulisoli]|nr:GNAT family N-acetyltransferase [Gluconacetobacter tumulisoli]
MTDLRDDTARHRFEMNEGNAVAFVDYSWKQGHLVLRHTEVPPALQGRGIAGRLARAVLDEARRRQVRIIPVCPFIAAYLRRHPDDADLIAAEPG